jgi:hypothetical protein
VNTTHARKVKRWDMKTKTNQNLYNGRKNTQRRRQGHVVYDNNRVE